MGRPHAQRWKYRGRRAVDAAVPDTSGISARRLPRGHPLEDPPKLLREFIDPIATRFGGSRLAVCVLAKQRFDSARRLFCKGMERRCPEGS
jgi:hypothetical protein